MTTPAQDHSHDDDSFEIDAQTHLDAVKAQRDRALDQAATWEAVARRERAVSRMLAQQIADLQQEAETAAPAKEKKTGR